jgi:hypothetical protein
MQTANSPGYIYCFDCHCQAVDLERKHNLLTEFNTFSDFDLIFKGSDAIERRGAFYTISDEDHPITKLMQSPKKVPKGTNVLIGLNIYKV